MTSSSPYLRRQDASRKFLEAKDVLIFRLEGSPRPLCSVLTLLSQPSRSVSVVVSQAPRDPLPSSPRAVSKSPSQRQQQVEGVADLDGVLRRTEEICRSLSSERSCGSSPAALVSAGLDSRPTRSLESLSPGRTRTSQSPSVGPPPSEACSSVPLGLDECDLEVERLIQLSDSLTQHNAKGVLQGVCVYVHVCMCMAFSLVPRLFPSVRVGLPHGVRLPGAFNAMWSSGGCLAIGPKSIYD